MLKVVEQEIAISVIINNSFPEVFSCVRHKRIVGTF